MTPRERHSSAGPGTALVDIPTGQVTPFPLLAALLMPTNADRETCWDEVYSCISSMQQKHLIELARKQGLLCECRFPRVQSQIAPVARAVDTSRFQLLSQLVLGKTDALPPVAPSAVVCQDAELDACQRAAVAKALHTPDICLIQGQAGTGKSRVAAEILTQAAARGQRVLLLAQTAAAIDRILEMVAGREQLFALRCVGREETLDGLPAAARALTFAERSRVLHQRSLESARQAQRDTEQRLARHTLERMIWPRLLELARQHTDHLQELHRLEAIVRLLPAEADQQLQAILARTISAAGVNGEFATDDLRRQFGKRLEATCQNYQERKIQLDQAQARLADERELLARQLAETIGRADQLRPLAEAKRRGRWWQSAWWRATFAKEIVSQFNTLEIKQQGLQSTLAKMDQELAELAAQEGAERRQLTEELEHVKAQFLAEQQPIMAHQIQTVQEKLAAVQQQCQHHLAQLPDSVRPHDLSGECVCASQERWEHLCAQEEEKGRFIKQWLDYVEEFSATLARRLPRLANVVAATVHAFHENEHFGDRQPIVPFDLLVLDEAHLTTEPELFKLGRRAHRWVLIGEPAWEQDEPQPVSERSSGQRLAPYRHHRPGPSPACFQKLWTHLHCDPGHSVCDWYSTSERLCCRLRAVPSQWSEHVESEPVADRPEIELRICSPPREKPFLAEVLFPAHTPLSDAKRYIYQELQEVAIRTAARQLLWREEADRLVLQLADYAPATEKVKLEEGVAECMVGPLATSTTGRHPSCTQAVEFNRPAWTLERAREWVEKHMHWRDLGRTAVLERSHRMSAPLAIVLEKLLYDRSRHARENGHAAGDENQIGPVCSTAPIEFIAVPAADRRDRRRSEVNSSSRTGTHHVGGAGLEQDLAVAGNSHLPEDLRGLRARGLVNYAEAQAVVHRLEELVADPILLQGVQTHRLSSSCPAVAVLALYPGQVELIRRLIAKSARLARCPFPIEVGLPASFRHRECLIAVISLTRSQGHRAVSYGESSDILPLALSRARHRIILIGDPGQLARRSQWRGPLDHLDENAAALEKRWADQLVKYIQGQ